MRFKKEERLILPVWADAAIAEFGNEEEVDFISFLQDRDNSAVWIDTKLTSMEFEAIHDEDPMSGICRAEELGLQPEIYQEAGENSRMLLHVGIGFSPILRNRKRIRTSSGKLSVIIHTDKQAVWSNETMKAFVSITNHGELEEDVRISGIFKGKGELSLLLSKAQKEQIVIVDKRDILIREIDAGETIDFEVDYLASEKDIKATTYPIGKAAIKKILEYSGIRGERYSVMLKNNPLLLAEIVNKMIWEVGRTTNNKCVVKVGDRMVRTIVSDRYAKVPASELFEHAVLEYFPESFPDAKFQGGFWSHELVSGTWNLGEYAKSFQQAAESLGDKMAGRIPALAITTSDVTKTAIKLEPQFIAVDNDGRIKSRIPLVNGTFTHHMGEKSIYGRLREDFSMVLANFDKAVEHFVDLDHRKIEYGKNALIRCLRQKKVAMPVQQAREAVANFAYDGECTALDVYLAVVDAYNYVCRDFPQDKAKCYRAYDAAISAMQSNWSRMDGPGDLEL